MTIQEQPSIRFSLLVYGRHLAFEDIERCLGLVATHMVRAGTVLSKASSRRAPQDFWTYRLAVPQGTNESETLVALVSRLLPHTDYLAQLAKDGCDVRLACSLVSDYGQLGFSFSEEAVKSIGALGLPIDVHILSYGMVAEGDR